MRSWSALLGDTKAVTTIEYALVGSLIFLAIIAGVVSAASSLGNAFNTMASSL